MFHCLTFMHKIYSIIDCNVIAIELYEKTLNFKRSYFVFILKAPTTNIHLF